MKRLRENGFGERYSAEVVQGDRDGAGDAPKRVAQAEGGLPGDLMDRGKLHW
jgi:hypothetical protein